MPNPPLPQITCVACNLKQTDNRQKKCTSIRCDADLVRPTPKNPPPATKPEVRASA